MQINVDRMGSSDDVEICVQKEKSSTKIQINMRHTGGQKDTEILRPESEKDSPAHDSGNGENGRHIPNPPLCPQLNNRGARCGHRMAPQLIPTNEPWPQYRTVWLCVHH